MNVNYTSTTARLNVLATFLILMIALFQQAVFAQSASNNFKGYGKASYGVGDNGTFMRTWLVSGPVNVSATTKPDNVQQENAFKNDFVTTVSVAAGKPVPAMTVNQQQLLWQQVISENDVVDLDRMYNGKDYVYAYALAEINSPQASNALLALGSDDGIKVWHNGKLVHNNWIPRGTNKDDDLVPLKLVKGSNQLLLKIQDMEGGWSFVARLLDKKGLTDQANAAARNGNVAKLQLLLDGGADVNAMNEMGISPLVAAKVAGRDGIVQMLMKKGARDVAVPAGELLVDNYYYSLKAKSSPGLAVLVANNEKILYEKAFGYADLKNKVEATPDTKFRIGSVTKQFTAAAILKLQESGLLNVNDKLSKYIPDFPRGDEVTIHHLLTHTSGIHSYTNKPDFIDRVTRPISQDSLISSFKNDPYDFNPGEQMRYNNSGYFLLGYIINKVSGKSYEQYLRETFFIPLQMTNTGIHQAGKKMDKEAKGYSKRNGKYDDTIDWDMTWAGGAGAMYSTLEDLWKWNQALYGGKVLSKQSLDAALTQAVLKNNAPPSMKYGYGLGLTSYRGEDIVTHSGGLHGFITHLTYYPKEKLTVVMFSNTDEPEVNFDPNRIAEAFLWQKMDKQDSYMETDLKPANLQQYTGRFELINVGVMTMTTESDKLFAQLGGQGKFEIFPLAKDEFFWKIVEAKIKFERDEKGDIVGAVLTQNGQEIKASKLKEETIVTINPEILDRYVGKYKLNADLIVNIFKENGNLFAQPTDQPKLAMLPLSNTEFVIKEINAKLTFVTDATGKASMIKLFMNNTNTDMPRLE